jgi:hypothetical protein
MLAESTKTRLKNITRNWWKKVRLHLYSLSESRMLKILLFTTEFSQLTICRNANRLLNGILYNVMLCSTCVSLKTLAIHVGKPAMDSDRQPSKPGSSVIQKTLGTRLNDSLESLVRVEEVVQRYQTFELCASWRLLLLIIFVAFTFILGAMQDDYNQVLESHDQDVVRILENQQAQQNKQRIALEVEYNDWDWWWLSFDAVYIVCMDCIHMFYVWLFIIFFLCRKD